VVAGDPLKGSPRLLVLGAGPAQLGLLEAAKARGVWTAVADREPAAPGFRLADRRCIVSTEDEPAIERLAGALDLDGIIAPGTDWPVAVAARVAEKLGLPHPISPQTALLATNKQRQRECLDGAGVPQPRWQVVTDAADIELEPPLVVKPPDRQGQKGLSLVRTREELASAVAAARSVARSGAVLVEELVDGPEATVIGFSRDGVFSALAVTDRLVADPPAFGVALAHAWPCAAMDMAMARDVAARAAAALGIEQGPTYTQVRMHLHSHPVQRHPPQVVEVAARLGGGHDAELVEAATGVALNDMAIDAALGRDAGDIQVSIDHPLVGGAVTKFLVAPPGVLESVEVPDGLDGVIRVRIYREPGFVFTPLRRGADRAGAVLAVGDSREQALARAEAAAQRIRFVTADAGALVQR
jgi:biotin carboxylase